MLPTLANAKIFSALDGTSGYHQIPLHSDSQELLIFSSPWGRWCFKRLPFGISSAIEVYQRAMSELLSELPGVICHQDDVLVYGSSKEEHDKRLHDVLEKFRSSGLKLNKSKCKIGVTELEFLGHLLSHRGIAPSPDKVSALKTMPFIQALEILCVRSWEWPRTLDSASFQTSHPYVSLWALLRQSTLSWDANSIEAFRKI